MASFRRISLGSVNVTGATSTTKLSSVEVGAYKEAAVFVLFTSGSGVTVDIEGTGDTTADSAARWAVIKNIGAAMSTHQYNFITNFGNRIRVSYSTTAAANFDVIAVVKT